MHPSSFGTVPEARGGVPVLSQAFGSHCCPSFTFASKVDECHLRNIFFVCSILFFIKGIIFPEVRCTQIIKNVLRDFKLAKLNIMNVNYSQLTFIQAPISMRAGKILHKSENSTKMQKSTSSDMERIFNLKASIKHSLFMRPPWY